MIMIIMIMILNDNDDCCICLSLPRDNPIPPPISGNIPVRTNFLLLNTPGAAPFFPGLVNIMIALD
jgi:hypothetical protein